MTATPYLVQLPSLDSWPSRTLKNGVSAMAINAESTADAKLMAKAANDAEGAAQWANATVSAVAAASDMADWSLRLKITSPASRVIFDETVVADGGVTGFVKATGTLTLTPGAIADDVVKIDTTYYKFAADPTAGTPDGSVGTPYLVDVGVDDETSLANLLAAINASGTGGVTYSIEIVAPHATVEATESDALTLSARALVAGAAGNAISTTVTLAAGDDGLAWGATTLTGGTGTVNNLSSLLYDMVAALNASADIAGAALAASTNVLTVAETTDVLGDHLVEVFVLPPDYEENDVGVPGFVTTITDGGSAADALAVDFAADSYAVPKVFALLGAAV